MVKSIRRICWLCCVLLTFNGAAQSPFYHYFQDSIKPGYRVSGGFDSVDVNAASYQHTLPSFFTPGYMPFSFDQLASYRQAPLKKRFSAIPHVGLRYSMGSNAHQLGVISYTQTIDSNTFVQMDYMRHTSQGAMRNASFESNSLQAYILHRKNRYATSVDIYFNGGKRALNGGLLGDTLSSPNFALVFQEVNKGNDNTGTTLTLTNSDAVYNEYRQFHVGWENYVSFTKDSLLKTGVFLNPKLQIANKRFVENGDLTAIYGGFTYDSLETRDLWQKSDIGASAGYFFHTRPFVLNAGVNATYWRFDNLDYRSDTTELSVFGDLLVSLRSGWEWRNNGRLNLAGALGEMTLSSALSKRFYFGEITAFAKFERAYPQVYQRTYYGNNVQYTWSDKELSTQLLLGGTLKATIKKIPVYLSGMLNSFDKLPLFIDSGWRQDTLTQLSVASFSVKADVKWRSLLVQPSILVQASNEEVVPNMIANMRFGFNGAIFKAKKLKACIGLDLGYTTSYKLMSYSPLMNTYVFSSKQQYFNAMPKLHAFAQFDLGYFRWFLRIENIEQAFIRTTNFEAVGYPVLPMQLRFGVSWDLFN